MTWTWRTSALAVAGARREASIELPTAELRLVAPPGRVAAGSYTGTPQEGLTVAGPSYRASSAADVGGGRQVYEGSSPQNEQDVLDVCGVLRAALNRAGGQWIGCQAPPEVSDVDCLLDDASGAALQVQVTRVERAIWEQVARTGRAEMTRTVTQAADAIWDAISRKSTKIPPRQRQDLLLALDALGAPAFPLLPVASEFRTRYSAQAAALGYKSIWLVGPAEDWTHRLD